MIGAWALIAEIVFAVRSERLLRRLEAEGSLPEEELPLRPSGKVERAAADAVFPAYQRGRRAGTRFVAGLVAARPRLRRERGPAARAMGDPSGAQEVSAASRVIGTPASALDTGQFALASSAMRWKSSSEMPATFAVTSRWLPVMPSPLANVTAAVT